VDELFETLTLIQTRKVENFPVVLFGKEYWKPLVEMMIKMEKEQTILAEDLNLFLVTDSVEEACEYIQRETFGRFEISKRKAISPFSVFFESSLKRKKSEAGS